MSAVEQARSGRASPKLSIEQRAVAIADRLVPNKRARAECPTLAGVIARQWQAAYEGARAAFIERGAA